MSWTDLDAADLAQVSYTKAEKGLTIRREEGAPKIVVEAVATTGDAVVFVRVPKALKARLARRISGSQNTALIAIIEEALDRLESGNERWRVLARASKD